MSLLGDPFSRPPNPNGQIPPAILAQNVRTCIVDGYIAALEAGCSVGSLDALSAPSAAVGGLERNRQPARGGVVDQPLFGGSGTTLIAAEKNGRIARIMELDPKYCDMIVQRWQDFTGQTAALEADGRTFDEVKNGNEKAQN